MTTTQAVRARGMIFSAPMVRAILDGTKTQTRRVVKMPPNMTKVIGPDRGGTIFGPGPYLKVDCREDDDDLCMVRVRCPYGYPGDRLWVRETWQVLPGRGARYNEDALVWRATAPGDEIDLPFHTKDGGVGIERLRIAKWRPAIHMPRAYSRITVEITDVRVERLQDITVEDIFAEIGETAQSAARKHCESWEPYDEWRRLWDSINGAGSWDLNPWVWAIAFKRGEARHA